MALLPQTAGRVWGDAILPRQAAALGPTHPSHMLGVYDSIRAALMRLLGLCKRLALIPDVMLGMWHHIACLGG